MPRPEYSTELRDKVQEVDLSRTIIKDEQRSIYTKILKAENVSDKAPLLVSKLMENLHEYPQRIGRIHAANRHKEDTWTTGILTFTLTFCFCLILLMAYIWYCGLQADPIPYDRIDAVRNELAKTIDGEEGFKATKVELKHCISFGMDSLVDDTKAMLH